jgi:NAD(P)-dependent dehydrogenase (short-subunit alcohol dehydrogenase family)
VSKAALECLAKTYANEASDSPIKVNIVDPAATSTRMRAEAYPGEDQSTLPTPEEVAEAFVPLAMPDWTATGQIVDLRKTVSPRS